MPKGIGTPRDFNGLSVCDALARVWIANPAGTFVRQTCHAEALRQMASGINFGLGRVPRIIASNWRGQGESYSATGTTDPLWQARFMDRAGNGQSMTMHLLLMPRTVGSGDAEVYREGDTADTSGTLATSTNVASSVSYPDSLHHVEIKYDPITVTDALANIGITVANGPRVCGWVLQYDPVTVLYPGTHDVCSSGGPYAGDVCTALHPESVRAALQTLREDYLPVLASWCADDIAGGNQPATSDYTGFVITATTLTNILDGSSTSRSATTPGISCHVQHAGHGPPSITNGKRVKVAWSVLADTDDGSDAVIQVEGSATHSSNTDSVTVSVAGAPTWYDGSAGILLDSQTADGATTTARNKIDISAKVNTSGSVWIYGWRFEMEHI